MAFTLTASSVNYTDLAGGSAGFSLITGSVVLDAGTTSGVLNPVTIGAAVTAINPAIGGLIAGCRDIIYISVTPYSAVDTVRAEVAYDATTDSEQATVTVGTANTDFNFFMYCKKSA